MSVVLTVVQTVGEADVIAGLLQTEGIACAYPEPPWYEGHGPGIEVRVAERDLERARELIGLPEASA